MLEVAVLLSVVNERLIEWFISPIFERFGLDTMWLMYLALVTGGVISWAAGVNLFEQFGLEGLPWVILSSIVVGGGSNLVHDLFGAAQRANRECA